LRASIGGGFERPAADRVDDLVDVEVVEQAVAREQPGSPPSCRRRAYV
jgi:hypothetical protein